MVRFTRRFDPVGATMSTVVEVGLLIEYHSWEKIATILCKGEILRVRGENVEKAGKKDFENR